MQINEPLFVNDDGLLKITDFTIERRLVDKTYVGYEQWNNPAELGFSIRFCNEARVFAIIDSSSQNDRLYLIGKKNRVFPATKEKFLDHLRINHEPFFEWILWDPLS